MKGLMVISFKKSPGAYLDFEYPEGISRDWTDADINLPYSMHRMRNMRPNYLYVKIRGHMVASFFTGFDYRDYVAYPNKCLYVILDNENPNKLEGQIIRAVIDIMPKFREIDPQVTTLDMNSEEYKLKVSQFKRLLEEEYFKLESGQLEPAKLEDVEVIVGEGSKIATTDGAHTGKVVEKKSDKAQEEHLKKKISEKKVINEIEEMAKNLEEMEKESLREEIRKLHKIMKEKDNKIHDLQTKLSESAISMAQQGESTNAETLAQLNQMAEALKAKEDELNMWREKVAEMNENLFINQDTIAKMTEMTMQQSQELQEQSRTIIQLKNEIKEKDKQIQELIEENKKLKNDLENLNAQIKTMEQNNIRAKYSSIAQGAKDSEQSFRAQLPRANNNIASSNQESQQIIEKLKKELEQEKVNRKNAEWKLKELKSEVIQLKKNIKIQRREIQELYNKLDAQKQ
ncbi:MAG: hypothetical protein ACTSU2_05200 [Promethearchaeota archaeon]